MLSVAGKLHLLLITTVLGVGLYMFLLYKEVNVFQKEIADLRIKVQAIVAQLPPLNVEVVSHAKSLEANHQVCSTIVAPATTIDSPVHQVISVNKDIVDETDDLDDTTSVTSNEIKEILTNIQDDVPMFSDDYKEPSVPSDDVDVSQTTTPVKKPKKESIVKNPEEIGQVSKARAAVEGINLYEMTDAQIREISYDNLRTVLRTYGVTNPRGSKSELVEKAIQVREKAPKTLDI